MTRQERGSEATEGVFCLVGKKVFLYCDAHRLPLFNSQPACCTLPVGGLHRGLQELCNDDLTISTHPWSARGDELGLNSWCLFHCTQSRIGHGRRVIVVGWPCGEISLLLVLMMFFDCTRPTACARHPCSFTAILQ